MQNKTNSTTHYTSGNACKLCLLNVRTLVLVYLCFNKLVHMCILWLVPFHTYQMRELLISLVRCHAIRYLILKTGPLSKPVIHRVQIPLFHSNKGLPVCLYGNIWSFELHSLYSKSQQMTGVLLMTYLTMPTNYTVHILLKEGMTEINKLKMNWSWPFNELRKITKNYKTVHPWTEI